MNLRIVIMNNFSKNAMKTIKNFMLVAFAATAVVACQKEMADNNDFTSAHSYFSLCFNETQRLSDLLYSSYSVPSLGTFCSHQERENLCI